MTLPSSSAKIAVSIVSYGTADLIAEALPALVKELSGFAAWDVAIVDNASPNDDADRMAALFVGAMCAVGTFGVNGYGFPALYMKIAVFFAEPQFG